MQPVTAYLRTALFSSGGSESHLPNGVMILRGSISDRPSGCVTIVTSHLLDGRGKLLEEKTITLQLPWAKIDHLEID